MAVPTYAGNDFVNLAAQANGGISPSASRAANTAALLAAVAREAKSPTVAGRKLYLPGNASAYPFALTTKPAFPFRLVGDDIATTIYDYAGGSNVSNGPDGAGLVMAAWTILSPGGGTDPNGSNIASTQLNRGDNVIAGIASTANLAAGGYALLRATNATGFWPGTNSNGVRGEIVRIKTVDSGTQVTLWDCLEDTYLTTYATRISPLIDWHGCEIDNLTFKNSAPGTGFDSLAPDAVTVRGCLDFHSENVKVIGSDGAGFSLQSVREFEVLNFQPEDFTDVDTGTGSTSAWGYGLLLWDGCQDGTVQVHAKRVRHAVTTGSNWCGIPRHITIRGTARECTGTSWDTHAEGQHLVFENCQVANSSPLGYSSDASFGMKARCPNVRFKGGIINLAHGWGIYCHSNATPDVEVDGVTINTVLPHALENSAAGVWFQGQYSTMKNCTIMVGQASTAQNAAGGITALQADADGITATNNQIRRLSGSGSAPINVTSSGTNCAANGNTARGGYATMTTGTLANVTENGSQVMP